MKRLLEVVFCSVFLSVVSMAGVGASAETSPSQPAATNAENTGPPVVSYSGGLLSVTAKNAEIREVLTKIGAAVNAEARISEEISGKVTISFQNLGLEEGLARLVSGEGTGIVLGYDKNGSVKLVMLSRRAAGQTESVVKVRKVRDYFSPADQASSMSLDEVKDLTKVLRDPKKKDKWVRAAKKIINIKKPEAKPYLKELMQHEDDFVRDQAMNEYAMLVDVEDADFILEMARDKSWETRGAAAYISMTLVDDPRQVPVLIEMLKDEKVSVRDAAIRALGFKRLREAVPFLEQLLSDLISKDQDGHTRATAAEALYSITGNKYEWMTPEQRKNHDERGRQALERIRKASEQDKQ